MLSPGPTPDCDTVISVRLSAADKATLDFVLPRAGFKTQSAFCRAAVTAGLANALVRLARQTSPTASADADDIDAAAPQALVQELAA